MATPASQSDELWIKYGYRAIIGGFILVTVIIGVTIWQWDAANVVALVVGLVTSTVGTVIGDSFGIQVGSHGRAEAEAARDRAEVKADVALIGLPRDEVREALREARVIE
jgi:hypothetical protein